MKNAIVIGAAVFLSIFSLPSLAEPLDFDSAIKALVGKTWLGTNNHGDDFWFWHEGGSQAGNFGVKFYSDTKGTRVFHGRWKKKSDAVCWHWPNVNRPFCYVKFELHGDKLDMTRADGVVHSGTLVDGNTAGL